VILIFVLRHLTHSYLVFRWN